MQKSKQIVQAKVFIFSQIFSNLHSRERKFSAFCNSALVLFGLLLILASLVARRGRRYFDTNLQESIEQENEGSEGSFDDCSEDANNDSASRNIDLDIVIVNEVSANGIVKERDLCTIEKEETKHVTFIDCAQ